MFRFSCASSNLNVLSTQIDPGVPDTSGNDPPCPPYEFYLLTDVPIDYTPASVTPVTPDVTLPTEPLPSYISFVSVSPIAPPPPYDSTQILFSILDAQKSKFFIEFLVPTAVNSKDDRREVNALNQSIVDKSIFDQIFFENEDIFDCRFLEFLAFKSKYNLEREKFQNSSSKNIKEIFILSKIFGETEIFKLLGDDNQFLSFQITYQPLIPDSKNQLKVCKRDVKYSDLLTLIHIFKFSPQFRASKIIHASIGKYLIFLDFETLENFSFPLTVYQYY